MRRFPLPPVGAFARVEDIRPSDRLYLVSPAKGDGLMFLRASREGVEVGGLGPSALMSGLAIWNKNIWEDVEFYVRSLNLSYEGRPNGNDYGDAYIFRDIDLAFKYSDFCLDAPDERWIDRPGGIRQRLSVRPFVSERSGEHRPPVYD